MHTEPAKYEESATELTGMLAWDPGHAEKRPGILVVHAAPGLDGHPKGRAIGFAKLGYLALACDMYGPGIVGDRQRVMARVTAFRDDPATLCSRAAAGLDVLRTHPLCDGRLAAIGYCFGGMTVLQLARSGAELAGVVSVHGSLQTKSPAQPGAVKAKVLACHGALDPHVPMTHVNAFIEEMNQAGCDWQLIVYGGAMHGFAHEGISGMPGVAYNALADARSAEAIKDFFSELFSLQPQAAK